MSISFKHSNEISTILLCQHQSGIISSVDEYIPTTDFLLKKLGKLIQSLISLCKDQTQSNNTTLSISLNKACVSNKHFMNICSLLFDFHEYTETVKFETDPIFFLIPCCQRTNESSTEHSCSKMILSPYKLTKTKLCRSCSESKFYAIRSLNLSPLA